MNGVNTARYHVCNDNKLVHIPISSFTSPIHKPYNVDNPPKGSPVVNPSGHNTKDFTMSGVNHGIQCLAIATLTAIITSVRHKQENVYVPANARANFCTNVSCANHTNLI